MMESWKIALVAFLMASAASIVVTMVYSELVEIYFKAKLKYANALIGVLGKALEEAGRQLQRNKKETDD